MSMSTASDSPVERIVGLDLSLTETGVAVYRSDRVAIITTYSIHSTAKGIPRILEIRNLVVEEIVRFTGVQHVVIEGLALQSRTGSALDRAGLWFLVTTALYKREIPVYVVPPMTLKKFITGKGNSDKNIVLREIYKRWHYEAPNDNEGDAYGLCRMGLCLAGLREPDNNQQRDSLKKASLLS